MARKYFLFLVVYLTFTYPVYSQDTYKFDSSENKCVQVFEHFALYLKGYFRNEQDIVDSSSIKYILLNYIFIDRKLDSIKTKDLVPTIFQKEEYKILKGEIFSLYRFFQEREDKELIDNLQLIPLRLSSDTLIYNRMTKFQKVNTYVLYDKREMDKPLFYILFFPSIKRYTNEPRIWSWKLGYQFGKFLFTSPNGEIGYEHIFP